MTSRCESKRWMGHEGDWFCTTCHPDAEACEGGRTVETSLR